MTDRKLKALASPTREDTPADDRTLMERINAGDASALQELLRHYWAPLVSFATRITASRDSAEDVVQEVMFRVWKRRATWTPSERLQSFLYRITRNLALNERKRNLVRSRYRESRALDTPQGPPTPAEVTEASEMGSVISGAITSLPKRQREVFVLARYHGHSYREIAEILDVSPQTVANQMSAALDRLRNSLRAYRKGEMQAHLRLVRSEPGDS